MNIYVYVYIYMYVYLCVLWICVDICENNHIYCKLYSLNCFYVHVVKQKIYLELIYAQLFKHCY